MLVEPSLGDDADFSGYGVDMFCSLISRFSWIWLRSKQSIWLEAWSDITKCLKIRWVTQSSQHAQMKKKPIWPPVLTMWGFAGWKMLDFSLFKTNSWIFIDSTRVSMNFPYISQAAGLFLSDFSKFLSKVGKGQFWLDPLVRVWEIGAFSLLDWSNHPLVLFTVSQEHLLWNYIGGFSQLCQLWLVGASKMGENWQKWCLPRWFSVFFSH